MEQQTEVTHTTSNTIIEKTISPDMVTKMYREVRKQVLSDIIRAFTIKHNLMEGRAFIYKDDIMTGQRRYKASFVLNGNFVELDGLLIGKNIADNTLDTASFLRDEFIEKLSNLLYKENIECIDDLIQHKY